MDREGGGQGATEVSTPSAMTRLGVKLTLFRVDTTVLPLLFLGLLVFQLDRMNLASALTAGFATDIGVTQATINLGNQLMFLFIVVFEIPCNMLLQRVYRRAPDLYSDSILTSSHRLGPASGYLDR